MGIRKLSLRTDQSHQGQRLDQLLADWLPRALGEPVSKAWARKLIVAGAVYLNRKRVRIASKEIQAGAVIDVFADLEKLKAGEATRQDRAFVMVADRILFEDAALIAVNKPAGLPTQPTLDEARENLYAAVKKFLAARDGVAEAYVGLHHRLDRDTSGVVIFTKDKAANAGVARAFAEHLARKTYLALTERGPGDLRVEWTVRNYLGKDVDGPRKGARFKAVRAGGDPAHTDFTLRETFARALLIEARPRTGRTHQIRVHLSEDGRPILGDRHYGADPARDPIPAPRVLLHASRLELPHPLTGTPVAIESPLPEDFRAALAKLRIPGAAR